MASALDELSLQASSSRCASTKFDAHRADSVRGNSGDAPRMTDGARAPRSPEIRHAQ
jgi:hypothetical protein